jgi:hypothetical protein
VAIVAIVVLLLALWFFLGRGGDVTPDRGADINVDVNPPAAGTGGGGGGTGGGGGGETKSP